MRKEETCREKKRRSRKQKRKEIEGPRKGEGKRLRG